MSFDNLAYRYPVSIKGIVVIDGKIPLLKNERNEFELPGGKLEINEQPIRCVEREIKEELNLDVRATQIIDSWLYTIKPDVHVVIISYGCFLLSNPSFIAISNEHKELIMADIKNIHSINMPQKYKDSIKRWLVNYPLQGYPS